MKRKLIKKKNYKIKKCELKVKNAFLLVRALVVVERYCESKHSTREAARNVNKKIEERKKMRHIFIGKLIHKKKGTNMQSTNPVVCFGTICL